MRGEYQIGNNENIPSGKYIMTEEGLIRFDSLDEYLRVLGDRRIKGAMQYINMYDLKKHVTNPEGTIMVCHIPRKFDSLEGVDVAHFFESREYERGKDEYESKGVFPVSIFNPDIARRDNTPVYSIGDNIKAEMWKRGSEKLRVLVEQKTNRGNNDLKKIYDESGLTDLGLAFPSAHFHESSHRAHDKDGNPVVENTFVRGLYWNSGCLDQRLFGMLHVNEYKVSYQNVNLRDYLR
ncbi:hypothetical protein J4221_05705 [Candidatus Pacearchaeota archaeon]|nr:hypothetical protein [Candidatus Pacearchaeota archaeon]